jgi:hypothetical protein
MNRLRRLGVLRYSRQHIDVYVTALAKVLQADGIKIPQTAAHVAETSGAPREIGA